MWGEDGDRDFIRHISILHLHPQGYFNKLWIFTDFWSLKASSAVSPEG